MLAAGDSRHVWMNNLAFCLLNQHWIEYWKLAEIFQSSCKFYWWKVLFLFKYLYLVAADNWVIYSWSNYPHSHSELCSQNKSNCWGCFYRAEGKVIFVFIRLLINEYMRVDRYLIWWENKGYSQSDPFIYTFSYLYVNIYREVRFHWILVPG